MKKFYLFFTCFFLGGFAIAQQLPIYSQYFKNPYLYNPSFAGDHGSAVFYLTHKQQWRGIEGAPVTSTFSFHTPAGKRAAIGLNIYNDKRGLLNTTSALVSFGYTVPFSEDHIVRFGLSAGLGTNSIDLEKLDETNDPAVINLISENIFLDGQFGVNYQFKNFTLGFSIPKLYESNVFSDTYFGDFEISRFRRYMFTANYKINIDQDALVVEPMVVYRITEGLPSLLEGGAVLHIKKTIWAGATYRQDYGFTGLAGFNIKDNLSIGYAYEYATNPELTFADGTHEIQLGLRLGKKREKIKKTPRTKPAPVAKEEPVKEEPAVEENVEEEKPVTAVAKPVVTQQPVEKEAAVPVKKEPVAVAPGRVFEQTAKKGKHALELDEGNYVIVGVFGQEENAKKQVAQLQEKGVQASYGYNSQNKYFYVHTYKAEDKQNTRVERDRLRKTSDFKNAWMLTIEDPDKKGTSKLQDSQEPSKQILNQMEQVKPTTFAGTKQTSFEGSPVLDENAVNFVFDYDNIISVTKGSGENEMKDGNYLITAVYSDYKNAAKNSDENFREGFQTKIGYHAESNYYYVYLFEGNDLDKVIKERNRFRKNQYFNDTWILHVE